MKSVFSLLMLVVLVLAQGTSLATSICRHASIQDHIAARQSLDSGKAAVAFAEETAGAAAAKKGSIADGSSGSAFAALPPVATPAAAMLPREAMLPEATDRPPLVGISLRPPLPPPLA